MFSQLKAHFRRLVRLFFPERSSGLPSADQMCHASVSYTHLDVYKRQDLTRRDDLKKLSVGEKRTLTKARQILCSELALARNITEEQAAARLDEILAEGRITPEDTVDAE